MSLKLTYFADNQVDLRCSRGRRQNLKKHHKI